VRIRPSVPEDAEAIAVIQVRSFQVAWAEIHPAEELAALDPAPRVPLWRERAAFVAENEDGPVGVAEIGPSDEEQAGEVYRFFVDPGHWRQGVGRALLAHAVEQLRGDGFREALLWVHAESRGACAFYEAAGWRPDGSEKNQDSMGRPTRLLCYRISLRRAARGTRAAPRASAGARARRGARS